MVVFEFGFDPEASATTPVNAVHTRQNDPAQAVELGQVLVKICVLCEHTSPNQTLKLDLCPTESQYAAWPHVMGLAGLWCLSGLLNTATMQKNTLDQTSKARALLSGHKFLTTKSYPLSRDSRRECQLTTVRIGVSPNHTTKALLPAN